MEIFSKKLNFLTEVLNQSDHSGHYRSSQSTLQLSSKFIDVKTYIDAYNCSYSKEQCINSTQQHVHHTTSSNWKTRNTIVENNIIKKARTLILKRTCPTTIYVAAMFHPTIGQCAHQSLISTATPELGMISTRN